MISAGAHGRGDMHANNVLHSNACLDSGRCRFATCILRYRTRSGVCCIGEMSAWEESKARQGQGQEKAPRSEVRHGKNPQIHHLLPQRPPATPSQPYNTMHHDTVPRRLESIAIADTLMDPPRSRQGKPSPTSRSVPVRLLQVARQSNLIEHYYCQPAYMPILHHPPCILPYPERC
jgi:hypothetical protein